MIFSSSVSNIGDRSCEQLTSCSRLVALFDRPLVIDLDVVGVLLLSYDSEMRSIESTAVQHDCGLDRGGLLEVDGGRAGGAVKVDRADLSTEPVHIEMR